MPRIVVAAACGLTLLSACSPDGSSAGSSAVSPSGVATELPGTSATPVPQTVRVGTPPQVPYVAGRWYVAPDRRLRLPARRGVTGAVEYDDGLLVADARAFEGTVGLARVRHGRWVSPSRCSGGAPALSADGRHVAWATARCPESGDTTTGAVHRARVDGTHEEARAVGAGLVSVVGFLGDDVVYQLGFAGGVWVSDLSGAPRRVPGIDHARDISPRRPLLLGGRGDRTDLALRPDGTVVWRARTADLAAFSPSGKRVLAHVRDGLEVLRSRDGSRVATLDLPADGEIGDVVWESERAVLAEWHHGTRSAIVRLHLDGRTDRATPWRPVDAHGGPWILLP